jgi:hypothetical protein
MAESLTFNNCGQWELHKSEDWMVHSDFEDRDEMPEMKGNSRDAALKDLKAKTKTRMNKETGKAEFLLHRGVGEQEAWAHDDNSIDDVTSWTPHHHIAHEFSRHYNNTDAPSTHKDRTMSAWVPEDQVHSIPIHGMNPYHDFYDKLRTEHEVVVKPHKFSYASNKERDAAHAASVKSKLI